LCLTLPSGVVFPTSHFVANLTSVAAFLAMNLGSAPRSAHTVYLFLALAAYAPDCAAAGGCDGRPDAGLPRVPGDGHLVITDPTVTKIRLNSYKGCTNLLSVRLAATVDIVYNRAFQDCSNLMSVEMPGVTTIGPYAFAGCSSLTTVTTGPAAVTYPDFVDGAGDTFADTAFEGLTGLDWYILTLHCTPWNPTEAVCPSLPSAPSRPPPGNPAPSRPPGNPAPSRPPGNPAPSPPPPPPPSHPPSRGTILECLLTTCLWPYLQENFHPL